MMERVCSIEEFVAEPVGRFFVGPTFFVWCHAPNLCGSVTWGRPTETDVRQLVAAWDFTLHPALASGFVVIMDDHAVEYADWRTLSIVVDAIRRWMPRWRRLFRRQAVVIPPGIIGMMIAGIAPLVGVRHRFRLFRAPGDAICWLGHPDGPAAASEVERRVDEARGTSPLLRALRDYLDQSLDTAGVQPAARALGMARRSLQRELGRERTSFRAELDLARVRAASSMLAYTDEKVEVIARKVGGLSASRLSALFRRHVGETPAEHRRRLEAATGSVEE